MAYAPGLCKLLAISYVLPSCLVLLQICVFPTRCSSTQCAWYVRHSQDFPPRGGVGHRLKRTKKNRPGPDGWDDSHWDGLLHVQKLMLSVFDDVNCLGNLSMSGTFLISSLPPPDNCGLKPQHAQYRLLSRLLLSFSNNGSIWIQYLDWYSEIFQQPNFQVVKWKSTFNWKMPSQAELETKGSRLATIFGLPHLSCLEHNICIKSTSTMLNDGCSAASAQHLRFFPAPSHSFIAFFWFCRHTTRAGRKEGKIYEHRLSVLHILHDAHRWCAVNRKLLKRTHEVCNFWNSRSLK